MKFGYFDDCNKEYVITRPDTPKSWSNYLGSTEYGAIITNNAGGYSFYKSAATGRFLRLRFNSIPLDQPGRYFYIYDKANKDFWSSSWQPTAKPLDKYKSECRHGTAYTVITSEYTGVKTETKYFVPLSKNFEYWHLKITNNSADKKELRVFSYCEFSNHWDTQQDLVNLQYSKFLCKGEFVDSNLLRITPENNLYKQNPNGQVGKDFSSCWIALCNAPVTGFDTDREKFIGIYGTYKEPQAVMQGECTDSLVFGGNSCGTLQTDIELAPGESKEILVLLGIGEASTDGKQVIKEFGSIERMESEFSALKENWHSKLDSFKCKTPDEDIDNTINVWGLYNCFITFAWSRAASLIYNGERDGLGFRDSVQDIIAVSAAIPQEAEQRLERLLSAQFSNGGALPVVGKDFTPGKEPPLDPAQFRSDDCQWFFNAVPVFVAETGKTDFYRKVIPYADEGEGTVYEHLKKALVFNLERMGMNGLPCGLLADWNDCLKLGYKGESLFVAFQLRYGLGVYSAISILLGETNESAWALKERDTLDKAIQKKCWDGEWFIWAIDENGKVYGTHTMEEGQIYFNTQVWSVISGAASPEQAKTCLESVRKKLATQYGLMLCAPPFEYTEPEIMSSVVYLPGIKENAGIFNHTQGWGIIAECLQGNGSQAYQYCKACLPASYNNRAEIRQSEPYVIGQTTYSSYSTRPGNTDVSWLSGAAAWNYYSITQYILGIQPQVDGLVIDPCIPPEWDSFKVERKWRGMLLHIEVRNLLHHEKGIARIEVDGKIIEDKFIPVENLHDNSCIIAVMK